MKYIINGNGITFIVDDLVPPELPHEPEPPPIPDDVAVAVVKREAAKIEAWANVPTLSR